MAGTTRQYVLVHGASHGAWCWDEVAARLRQRGHLVVAPDLPGHGRRVAEARRASLAAYATAVVDAMAQAGVSRGILVGHSMGGVVIPGAAERAPGRVRHLVFLYPAEMAWARWMGDLPRDDPRTAAALARLTPQPLRPWLERLPMRRFHALGLPASYIRCRRDAAVVPEAAARFAARLGVRPIDLDTAHGPMLSAPDALVKALETLPV
jgi:pimeloyl-ACP methyl ester carboxylesterase